MSEPKIPPAENSQPVGPALDRLIAEHVMGWTRTGDDDHTRPLHATETRRRKGQSDQIVAVNDYEAKGPHPRLLGPNHQPDYPQVHYLCDCGGDYASLFCHVELPPYSTDIAYAWEVFGTVQQKCGYSKLSLNASGVWTCTLESKDRRCHSFWQAGTVMEAICRCALGFLETEKALNLNQINPQA